MSFIFYFAVLVVAAASALFGLDLLTAPLPQEKPPAQVASTAVPSKLEQRAADRKEEAIKQASPDDQVLSPVYPTAPGGNKDVRLVYPPTNPAMVKQAETTGAAQAEDKPKPSEPAAAAEPPQKAPSQPQQQQANLAPPPAAQPEPPKQPADTSATAKAEPAPARPETAKLEPAKSEPAKAEPAAAPAAQPVAQQSAGRCDVSACAAAYHSFRASDCTYQPFDGPRRVCEGPPRGEQQKSAERTAPRTVDPRIERAAREAGQARKDARLNAVAARVRQMTSDEDEAYPIDRSAPSGRRIIVIERGSGYDDED